MKKPSLILFYPRFRGFNTPHQKHTNTQTGLRIHAYTAKRAASFPLIFLFVSLQEYLAASGEDELQRRNK